MTGTPARSRRVGWGGRWSLATRAKSSTTTTVSCSTHTVERGNPADAPQLAPAVGRVIHRTCRRPRTVSADRGYGEASVENDLHDLGVRTVVIPRKGRPGKARQAHEYR
jgi:IS5 family transposase